MPCNPPFAMKQALCMCVHMYKHGLDSILHWVLIIPHLIFYLVDWKQPMYVCACVAIPHFTHMAFMVKG